MAWWAWAIGLAIAASRTTNPVLLALIVATAALVVAARRGDAPWTRGFRTYLVLGLVVIGVRVIFHAFLGSGGVTDDLHVLFTVPEVPLPGWAAGIRLGGPVVLEGVLAAVYGGLRLATLLTCVGAANMLANPKRALRLLPGALYEVGVCVVVALTVAPQVVESGQRILRARRLRGDTRWLAAFRRVAMPVLQDALSRSLALAAAMDSRGYGRTAGAPARSRRGSAALLLAGLLGLAIGGYGVLAAGGVAGAVVLVVGAVLACLGLALGGQRVRRSRYRPDPWRLSEWLVAGSGAVAAVAMVLAAWQTPGVVDPSLFPLSWPTVSVLPVAGILVAALPALAAPPMPRRAVEQAPHAPAAHVREAA